MVSCNTRWPERFGGQTPPPWPGSVSYIIARWVVKHLQQPRVLFHRQWSVAGMHPHGDLRHQQRSWWPLSPWAMECRERPASCHSREAACWGLQGPAEARASYFCPALLHRLLLCLMDTVSEDLCSVIPATFIHWLRSFRQGQQVAYKRETRPGSLVISHFPRVSATHCVNMNSGF